MSHAPKADCKTCKGTGIKPAFVGKMTNRKYPASPCICTFVGHDMIESVRPIIQAAMRNLTEKESKPS